MRHPTAVAVLLLAAVSFALGALAAVVEADDGAGGVRATPAPLEAPAAAPTAIVQKTAAAVRARVCRPAVTKGERKPPSQALLDAFGVLRRERRDGDALPQEALDALKRRGLEPVDAASARLLRESPNGGRAWIVPVPDVSGLAPMICIVNPREGRSRKRRPVPAAPVAAAPTPREGVAIVSIGGAPAGGGGALADLVRGGAPPAVDPCAGPNRNMLGVSGVVPDGVPQVFLTSSDGTAVRADVRDNGFSFVVARGSRPAARYVVWTGGDGTPHVQPVNVWLPPKVRCPAPPKRARTMPVVTPSPFIEVNCFRAGPALEHVFRAQKRRAARRRVLVAPPRPPLACPAPVPIIAPGRADALPAPPAVPAPARAPQHRP